MKAIIALVFPFLNLCALLCATGYAAPITYTYDAAGRLVLVDYGNGTNLFKVYDAAGNLVERSAPGPLLHQARAGGQTTFAWTSLATGFQLVSTASLRPPITWTPLAVTPALVGNQFVATVNHPPGTAFVILRKP